MGKFTPTDQDRASFRQSGTIDTAAGEDASGAWIALRGATNLWITGDFVGTLALECSVDGGVTALPVAGADDQPRLITAPARLVIDEPENGVLYRLRATSWTSGAAEWRFSR